jgi:hypothetical protein
MRVAPVQELLKKKQRNRRILEIEKRTSQTPTLHADASKNFV